MPSRPLPREVEAFAFEKVSVGGTAVGLTAATAFPAGPDGDCRGATGAWITVETNTIHWREDGGTPTATDGHLAAAGGEILLTDSNAIRNFKAIQASAGATIQVTYYR